MSYAQCQACGCVRETQHTCFDGKDRTRDQQDELPPRCGLAFEAAPPAAREQPTAGQGAAAAKDAAAKDAAAAGAASVDPPAQDPIVRVNAADVDGAGGDGAGGAAAARDDEVLLKYFFDKHNLCPAMQQEVQSAYKAAGFPCKELKPLSYGSLAITYFRMTCLGASRPLFAGFPDRQGELLCLNVAAPLKSKTHFQKPAVSREYACMVGAACSQNGAILAAGDIVSISQRFQPRRAFVVAVLAPQAAMPGGDSKVKVICAPIEVISVSCPFSARPSSDIVSPPPPVILYVCNILAGSILYRWYFT